MPSNVPTMHTVTLAAANTEYNLDTLLRAIDPTLPNRCLAVQIQFDSNAGADWLHIGNPGGQAADDAGVELFASQAFTVQSTESNIVMLTSVALWSNGAGHLVRATVITR